MGQWTFYLLALMLFSTLLWRIVNSRETTERLNFYLFFCLYAGLFLHSFLWTDPVPSWLAGLNGLLFLSGTAWFLGEILWKTLEKQILRNHGIQQLKREKGWIHEIIMAAYLISKGNLGALIAIERKKPLDKWSKQGIRVDAALSREILYSVFTPPGALHDGGAVVCQNRLTACGVIFPLTPSPHVPKELGTRHRAALGFSEATDALCLVVSEETGMISLADRGFLYYDIPFDKLPRVLEKALRFRLPKNLKIEHSTIQTWELAKTGSELP